MDTVIRLEDVRRSYGGRPGKGGFEAVRGVNLEVRRGELIALLGTNGAGKTSLLEVIEGIAPATAGQVRVLGKDPFRDRAAVRRRTGIMLQEAGFPAELRVFEMAGTWARTLSRPRPVPEVLAEVGLSHRADVAVKSLSGGERRRLDLALAILGRPEVLFLDEPTTGLDPESRRSTWELIRRMVGEGTTVVLTTHYLDEAEELADRIAIMDRGRIVRSGTAAQIVAEEPAGIGFVLPNSLAPMPGDGPGSVELPPLSGQHRTKPRHHGGVQHTIATRDLQRDLYRLLTWAEHHGLELAELQARSASLEQAFLTIASQGADHTSAPSTTGSPPADTNRSHTSSVNTGRAAIGSAHRGPADNAPANYPATSPQETSV